MVARNAGLQPRKGAELPSATATICGFPISAFCTMAPCLMADFGVSDRNARYGR